MSPADLTELILKNLTFLPNSEQAALIAGLSAFVINHAPNDVFVLNGYAGTGKTSVIGAFVKALNSLKIKNVVLAPTGRAAKVAANLADKKASTIHKRLFRGNSVDPSNHQFYLAENRDTNTLFIVDEASLITDGNSLSDSLLLQLIYHVYKGPGCALILLGDTAQLPPVGQTRSLAMEPARLKKAGLNPLFFSLTTPARQAVDSGILYNAINVRNFLLNKIPIEKFKLYKKSFPDIKEVDPSELLDSLYSSWQNVGKDETIIITRSNNRANKINATIRRHIIDADDPIMKGEHLIISKNDYYWSKENKMENFLANGESGIVVRTGKKTKAYGRWFEDVELNIPDLDHNIKAKVMLRSLVAEGPNIPQDEMQRFYNRVLASSEGELSEKIKAALESPYYNALQVKYGYCVTCHKAQGGQWRHVYIDLGALGNNFSESDFFRWFYTAITRATEKIFFINSPFDIE